MKLPLILLACLGAVCAPLNVHAQSGDIQQLTAEEVELVVKQAATSALQLSGNAIIAVTDREGFVLALWDVGGKLPRQLPPFDITLKDRGNLLLYSKVAAAITRASTAAFLSSDQEAFTSRTAGFIIQQHFPPGIRNTPNGPLVGVGLSSLFYSDVNRVKMFADSFNGAATLPSSTVSPGVRADLFPLTSLNDSPGGVPLYKGGHLVGGVGVTGDGSPSDLTPAGAVFFGQVNRDSTFTFKTGEDTDELIALAGQTNFRPSKSIVATNVLINGIRIPYVYPRVEEIEDVEDVQELDRIGHAIDYPLPSAAFTVFAPGRPRASPATYPYPIARLGGYEGEIRFPFRNDPLKTVLGRTTVGKRGYRLTASDVKDIISNVAERAHQTRAGIRLPIGTAMQIFISVVSNPARNGDIPEILGVFRTAEATIFSWDVAVQKARTALFFSNNQLAFSSRTVGFLAERWYPPGLDGRDHGPLFGFQEAISLRQNGNIAGVVRKYGIPIASATPFLPQVLAAAATDPNVAFLANNLTVFRNNPFLPQQILAFPGNPNVPNGITIFPGGFPLYRNGELVGAVGVSGDGVDQDDIASSSGTEDFQPDPGIRADTYSYRGARLPYVKFPRDPER
jgi:uncharacterized protein GlcG (DUF336 family)